MENIMTSLVASKQSFEARKMKKYLIPAMTAIMMSAGVNAATVEPIDEQVSGEVATAASINASFQALITAVNDNAAQIAELRSSDVDLNGKTYDLQIRGISLTAIKLGTDIETALVSDNSGQDDGQLEIDIRHSTATLSFIDETQFTLDFEGQEVQAIYNFGATDIRYDDYDGGTSVVETQSITGTYSKTGNDLTLTLRPGTSDESILEAIVGKGGYTLHDKDNDFIVVDPDASKCVAQGDSNIDLTGDDQVDAYCRIQMESGFISGIEI